MSAINEYVKGRMRDIQLRDVEDPVRFSVSLDFITNFRLQYLAKKLHTNRANLSADLLEMAIVESEKALGLNPFDTKSQYFKEMMEATGGTFEQDDQAFYRVTANGEKIKIFDLGDESEIDYSLSAKFSPLKEDNNG